MEAEVGSSVECAMAGMVKRKKRKRKEEKTVESKRGRGTKKKN